MRGMGRVGGLGDLLGGGDVRMCGGLGERVELGGLGDRGGGGWTCGGLGLLLGGGGTCSKGRDATGMEMGRGDGGADRKRGAAGGDARRDEGGALDGGGDGLRYVYRRQNDQYEWKSKLVYTSGVNRKNFKCSKEEMKRKRLSHAHTQYI